LGYVGVSAGGPSVLRGLGGVVAWMLVVHLYFTASFVGGESMDYGGVVSYVPIM